MKNNILIEFGNKVRNIRKEQNISQEQLGFITGLHRTYIGMIERGEKNISLKNIQKLAIVLKINIKELFE